MIVRVLRAVRTPFTLLVLLAVLCYGAWWGWSNVIREIPPAAPSPCVEQPLPKGQLKTSQVTVSVYNGGQRKGLAADVGRALRDKGFKVQRTTNTAEEVTRTVIVGAGTKNPEVLLVKRFFKDAQVRADKRVDGSVDVLVGSNYGGFNRKGRTTIAVETATACLPSASTASPEGS